MRWQIKSDTLNSIMRTIVAAGAVTGTLLLNISIASKFKAGRSSSSVETASASFYTGAVLCIICAILSV
jgi:hypothetical protein